MIVVADTSVLLNLCQVGQAQLLPGLFKQVVIPPEVASEFTRLAARVSRFQGLILPDWICQEAVTVFPPAIRSAAGLDPGETAALALALEIHADAILLDERRGHQVAIQLGLTTIGILGVLLRAKNAGLLVEIRPVLDDLEKEARFWISATLRAHVLALAGEKS